MGDVEKFPDELVDQLLSGYEGPDQLTGPDGLIFVGLERADVHDLKPVSGEPLMQPDDGRTLLPTALSGRLPEDQEHAADAFHRQTEIGQCHACARLDTPDSPSITLILLRPPRSLRCPGVGHSPNQA